MVLKGYLLPHRPVTRDTCSVFPVNNGVVMIPCGKPRYCAQSISVHGWARPGNILQVFGNVVEQIEIRPLFRRWSTHFHSCRTLLYTVYISDVLCRSSRGPVGQRMHRSRAAAPRCWQQSRDQGESKRSEANSSKLLSDSPN